MQQQPGPSTTPYACPRCHTGAMPYTVRNISTAGWVTFAVLMVFCLPLFWIGLLMKEDQTFCSGCGARIG